MAKQKKDRSEEMESVDFVASNKAKIADFFSTASVKTEKFLKTAFGYFKEGWLKVVVLIASATQTYALINFAAPAWAMWLPFIGILLMEGAIPLWQVREADADAADGSITDKEKNKQERIANKMVWICIAMSAITMVGGVFIEVSEGALSAILAPNPRITAVMGWTSMIGIFLLGTLHLISDWKYKQADPFVSLERDHRTQLRSLERDARKLELDGKRAVAKSELKRTRQLINVSADELGRRAAQDSFARNYGKTANSTLLEEQEKARLAKIEQRRKNKKNKKSQK